MKKGYYSFVGIYTFTYAAIGVLIPLLGQYLAGIGFSGVQIGIVLATATAVGIGASPFWGYRSHHSGDTSRVLLLLCVAAALIIAGLSFVKLYIVFLIAYAAFTFFQAPIMPLTDAMTLENRMPFGAVRKWGSLSFAAGVFFAGQLAEATDLVVIFPLCALAYTVAWLIMSYLRRVGKVRRKLTGKSSAIENKESGEPAIFVTGSEELAEWVESSVTSAETLKKEQRGNYIILFKNKKLMALLFSIFFICGTNVAHNTYFGFLYRDVGGSIAGVGVALLLMCSGEAPFMAWTEKLEKILTMEKMILISMAISALRYLWYSTGPAPGLIIGTFFLQGMVNGIVLIEFVHYVAKLVEPAMLGMAMTLYQALSSSCSIIVCQLIGGAILDHYGAMQVYLFFSIYNMIGILLYLSFRLYKSSDIKVGKDIINEVK